MLRQIAAVATAASDVGRPHGKFHGFAVTGDTKLLLDRVVTIATCDPLTGPPRLTLLLCYKPRSSKRRKQ